MDLQQAMDALLAFDCAKQSGKADIISSATKTRVAARMRIMKLIIRCSSSARQDASSWRNLFHEPRTDRKDRRFVRVTHRMMRKPEAN